jgi:hypothetical protein
VNNRTTLGLVFNGGVFSRKANAIAAIDWMGPDYQVDSSINTWGENNVQFNRGGLNVNGKHKINEQSELTADIDYVRFTIHSNQNYQTQLSDPGSEILATKGNFPSKLDIVTARVDYSRRFDKGAGC